MDVCPASPDRCPIPRYFFHLRASQGLLLDDTGVEFRDLEFAYLDAFRAAGEMVLEMSNDGQDASKHCFEITDHLGKLLIELPFSEAFRVARPGRPQPGQGDHVASLAAATSATRRLAVEIAQVVAMAHKTVLETRRVLQRSRLTAS